MRGRVFAVARWVVARLFNMDLVLTPIAGKASTSQQGMTEVFVPSVGLTMALDLTQSLDSCYAMDVVDEVCISFVRQHLQDIDCFVDVGANQGLYSCLVLNESPRVRVVALEPDPYSQAKLKANIALNALAAERLILMTEAVGDLDGQSELMVNVAGNRGGSSLVIDQRPFTGLADNVCIPVAVRRLESIRQEVVTGPWMLKLDIEGMEFQVLEAFLDESEPEVWPTYVIVEAFGRLIKSMGGSPVELLIRRGFTLVDHDESNFCLIGPSRD